MVNDMFAGNFPENVIVSRKQLVLGILFKTRKEKWDTSCKKEKINTEQRENKEKTKRAR